ncbi:uncharacterized protein LOC144331929 isoform X2 [Macaca mulatta]
MGASALRSLASEARVLWSARGPQPPPFHVPASPPAAPMLLLLLLLTAPDAGAAGQGGTGRLLGRRRLGTPQHEAEGPSGPSSAAWPPGPPRPAAPAWHWRAPRVGSCELGRL